MMEEKSSEEKKKKIEFLQDLGESVQNNNTLTILLNEKINNSDPFFAEYFKNRNTSDFEKNELFSYFNTNSLKDKFGASSLFEDTLKVSEEINELKRKLKDAAKEINDTKTDKKEEIEKYKELIKQISSKEKINHILTRISENARERLLNSPQFQELFKNTSKCDAVVVSIDIRRSTELMLKARTPELFSKFITQLSYLLSRVIISNFGIFDKFTGDGILAFFPTFYSGKNAIIRAIKASQECHIVFKEHYYNSKDCFNVFIKDIGLGIGIDFGNVTLVNTENELTVVGIPVVYACRFSGADAGETILNHPAKEELLRLCPSLVTISETDILIKNEGTAIAYKASLNDAAYNLEDPDWDSLEEEYKK